MLLEKRIPVSYIFDKIKGDILYILSISVLFYLLKVYFIEYLPVIPLPMTAIMGTSISLILAFRINQSYDRWWEARKVWGSIVNDSRSLVMQLSTFISDEHLANEDTRSLFRQMAFRQMGWGYCLGQSLRGLDPDEHMEKYLALADREYIAGHNNRPCAMLMLHARDLKALHKRGAVNDVQQVQIDNTITRLCDAMGKCERIKNTIFPRTYSLIVHFFIYMFIVLLSLALVESVGLYEIPILTVIASAFFLIEKTGIHMQDPFKGKPTDTAVTSIATTIEINIRQLLADKDVPKPLTSNDYFIM